VVNTTVNQYSSTTILSIDNIRTFPVNMKLICSSVRNTKKSEFLACLAASTNTFNIYRQCTYIVFILQCHQL